MRKRVESGFSESVCFANLDSELPLLKCPNQFFTFTHSNFHWYMELYFLIVGFSNVEQHSQAEVEKTQ